MLTFKPKFLFFFNLNPYIVLPRWRHRALVSDWRKLCFGLPGGSTRIHLSHVRGSVSVSSRAPVRERAEPVDRRRDARAAAAFMRCCLVPRGSRETGRVPPTRTVDRTGCGGGCCRTADPLKDPSVRPEQRHGARRRKRTATRRRRGEQRGAWGRLRPHTGWFTWTWTAGFRRYGGGAGTG